MSEQVLCVHSLHLNLHFLHLRILLRVRGSWTQSQHAVGERDCVCLCLCCAIFELSLPTVLALTRATVKWSYQ